MFVSFESAIGWKAPSNFKLAVRGILKTGSGSRGVRRCSGWAGRITLYNLVRLQSPPCQIRQQREKIKSGFRETYHTSLYKFVSKSANWGACSKALEKDRGGESCRSCSLPHISPTLPNHITHRVPSLGLCAIPFHIHMLRLLGWRLPDPQQETRVSPTLLHHQIPLFVF